MTIVKICGLRTIEHLLAAAAAGADWVGLVFAPGPRRVTADHAASLIAALRWHAAGQQVKVLGLFVNEEPSHINAVAEHCGLDYVQLSGDESPAQAGAIRLPVVKAIRLDASPAEQVWLDLAVQRTGGGDPAAESAPLAAAHAALHFAPCPLLVDAHVPGAYGGTGRRADWDGAAVLACRLPLMLAGGLMPENVAEAIARVRPYGVDVSSGVEINGHKDVARIEAFVGAARAAG